MYHILLVEDDKVLRYGLQKCLEEEGYAVHPAENALQAAGILETEGADFLILDVNLPGEDGFSFYKRFACPREIPAVFLTARDEEADMLQGLDLGAEDYITKPFSIQVFLKKTAALLRRVQDDGLEAGRQLLRKAEEAAAVQAEKTAQSARKEAAAMQEAAGKRLEEAADFIVGRVVKH